MKEDEDEGEEGWQCLWCKRFFNPKHDTRALCHLLKISGTGIAAHRVLIPPLCVERYQALHDAVIATAECKKQSPEEVHDKMASRQLLTVTELAQKKSKLGTGGAAASSNSLRFNTVTKKHPYVKPNAHISSQLSIDASVQNSTMTQQPIL